MAVDAMGEQMHSPHSQAGVGSSHSLSMREKSQIKRRVNKEHNSNFRAGYININEEYLHKTGIRGRKRYLLYCFIGFLVAIALVNAVITAWLVYKFRIYHIGMAPIEFFKEQNILRFMEPTGINVIKMSNARLGGRYGQDFNISTNSTLIVGAKNIEGSSLKLKGKKAVIQSDNFTVQDKRSGKILFMTGSERMQVPLKKATNLHALSVQVGKLKNSRDFPDIVFESHKRIKVLGAEGVQVRSQRGMAVEPYGSVILNATRGSVMLESDSRVYLNQSLPRPSPLSRINPSLVTYKLCVCGNNGRVFGVPVRGPDSGCNALNEQQNPCEL